MTIAKYFSLYKNLLRTCSRQLVFNMFTYIRGLLRLKCISFFLSFTFYNLFNEIQYSTYLFPMTHSLSSSFSTGRDFSFVYKNCLSSSYELKPLKHRTFSNMSNEKDTARNPKKVFKLNQTKNSFYCYSY